ncbi:MAG: hypothetical protein RIC51_04025 [Erythrobacter sp.]|uniref:hypothetical protein n=1 Tax=Erythrobacter sp. TaxID=1042 RepID=UPI0032ECC7B4
MGRYGGDHSEPIDPWLAVVLVSYAVAYFLLRFSVEWPETCDILTGLGRAFTGLITQYACTELIEGGLAEKMLFVLLWSVPVGLACLGIGYRLKKARGEPGADGGE